MNSLSEVLKRDVFLARSVTSGLEIMQEIMERPDVQRRMADRRQLIAAMALRPQLRSAPDISKEKIE